MNKFREEKQKVNYITIGAVTKEEDPSDIVTFFETSV